jgi:DNA-binding transcriptional ArsR family regulator
VETNILSPEHSEEDICKLLALIGQPVRIQILLMVGAGEVCVCHMEAALRMRQASISQHLMILRKAGLVSSRRDGRNIYYRLNPSGCPECDRASCSLSGFRSRYI